MYYLSFMWNILIHCCIVNIRNRFGVNKIHDYLWFLISMFITQWNWNMNAFLANLYAHVLNCPCKSIWVLFSFPYIRFGNDEGWSISYNSNLHTRCVWRVVNEYNSPWVLSSILKLSLFMYNIWVLCSYLIDNMAMMRVSHFRWQQPIHKMCKEGCQWGWRYPEPYTSHLISIAILTGLRMK